ncbi:uncharacterized protein LOC106152359 [Lingula anatina]|uniref:Uncharacterized protein LOC106152359 n=1 Tax=Lingula anatina TaxID=7574 RepID=A0A2R2MSW8_LINAN|nr:uncharacterized protein LOC106152359 [Lingula anatina]|eukprot:XP_023933360.1 uncharacterized protein LOC106152359 [Lingula anatina]
MTSNTGPATHRHGFSYQDNLSTSQLKAQNLLDHKEVGKLREAFEQDEGIKSFSYGRDDGEGRRTNTTLWHRPGDDITGLVARSEKVAGTMEKLLGGELYHDHAKVVIKDPFTGGAHIWHLDYGYWYLDGFLFPEMATAWIAVDKADKTNGCLKILPGSHHAGRIAHVKVGDQVGADVERVGHLSRACPLMYAELDPGDAIFFHCNLLHRSDQNSSQHRRLAYLVAYNRVTNSSVYEKIHTLRGNPLNKVSNSAITECPSKTNIQGKVYFGGPKEDLALRKLEQ